MTGWVGLYKTWYRRGAAWLVNTHLGPASPPCTPPHSRVRQKNPWLETLGAGKLKLTACTWLASDISREAAAETLNVVNIMVERGNRAVLTVISNLFFQWIQNNVVHCAHFYIMFHWLHLNTEKTELAGLTKVALDVQSSWPLFKLVVLWKCGLSLG